MEKKRVLTVFGTRPEAIKMAPLVKELETYSAFVSRLVVTAQHREMMDQVLSLFDLKVDYDLDIMESSQTLTGITLRALQGLEKVFQDFEPHLVLVHGDTTTTLAGALAAYYGKIAVGHVEAGLRTGDKYQPYPEEMNRQLTGVLADYHFAPTPRARENLMREGVAKDKVEVTGNTVIDALLQVVKRPHSFAGTPLASIDFSRPTILMTAHRRENWGAPMEEICRGVWKLVEDVPQVQVLYPVHPNPSLRTLVHGALGLHPRIHLLEPLDYLSFCHVMNGCTLVLTDSGGIQEEAPALGKPVLVMREKTERPEALEAGTVKLVGRDGYCLYQEARRLLTDSQAYEAMARASNPFGDGTASSKICQFLERHLF